jgi:DNA modification methylase
MNIINLPISEIKPYIKNPRKNDKAVDAVATAIKNYGWKQPIVIDKNNEIIVGHTRWKAAKKLGLKEAPCLIADDLTEQQIKAYRIADNKVAEASEWDMELLRLELDGLDEFTGFDADFLLGQKEVQEDDFEIKTAEPTGSRGDIWQLGEHRLMCGDSTSPEDIAKLMNGQQAHLLITDPPYNVDYSKKTKLLNKFNKGNPIRKEIINDKMSDESFIIFLTSAFKTAYSVIKEGAPFYIWHSSSKSSEFIEAINQAGLEIRQTLIWVKSNIVFGMQDYHWKHEPCLYGWKEGLPHFWNGGRKERTTLTAIDIFELRNKPKDEILKWIEDYWLDHEENETTVLYEEKPAASKDHPTMKPIKLMARQVKNSSRIGDIVLDIFGGSGSTLMACEQLKRRCFTMELDPTYCDVIVRRWEQFTGRQATKWTI